MCDAAFKRIRSVYSHLVISGSQQVLSTEDCFAQSDEVKEVIIIGAGASGIAAGRYFIDNKLLSKDKFLILEARDRIGGRVHTRYDISDYPLELGAEFIHGENAITHKSLERYHLSTLPAPRKKNLWWGTQNSTALHVNQLKGEDKDLIQKLKEDYSLLESTVLTEDTSLVDYFYRRSNKGTRFKEIADVLFAQTCCTSVESLSAHDLQRECKNDTAGEEEFRIKEGYGLFFQKLSQGLPIMLDACVQKIEWKKGNVNIYLESGQVLKSKRCLITVPIGVLQSQSIQFDPPLNPLHQRAIDSFVMEAATKLIYEFSEKFWSDELVYMCHTGLAARWWTPTYGRNSLTDKTHPICCYVTSQRAEFFDNMTEREALQTGLKELSSLLGVSIETLNHKLVRAKRMCWASEKFTLGGYAAVPVGKSDARVDLAVPVEDTLFFSGEAIAYFSNPQTVHGAMDAGVFSAQLCSRTST